MQTTYADHQDMFMIHSGKVTGCQNTVCYIDMPANKVYKLRLFRCILLPSDDLPICRSTHITVREEYSHDNPAG